MAVLLRPCSTSAGFTATPERPQRLDMQKLKRLVAAAGFTLVLDARILLLVRWRLAGGSDVEASLYDDGKVLLKTTDRRLAEAGYAALEPHLAVAARP